ncbi:uncharacterized protein BJ212DRAFT_1321154 [Suillus subaureus]|uniref:Uncharacterized protein n=1 Tax=Suillus subaureus TaxID=48587 RepID=A0A9P7EL77_9AGAM|nr:uncharacterized protein BJ212DRAFT_1321154 [Suillus subaureus]KAG1824567.1 hypothetical protein BJ212DRAFT_1321154 [Suillus subaureus]
MQVLFSVGLRSFAQSLICRASQLALYPCEHYLYSIRDSLQVALHKSSIPHGGHPVYNVPESLLTPHNARRCYLLAWV